MAVCAMGDGLDTDSFWSKQLGYFCVRSHDSLRVVFTQLQKAPKDCGFCTEPQLLLSRVSLQRMCLCTHLRMVPSMLSLSLVSTDGDKPYFSSAAYRGTHDAS